MFFSFKLRSHVKEGQTYEEGQLLVDHLNGVREIALETNSLHGVKGEIEKVIDTVCLCHDFGKASSYFQKYLRNEYNGDYKNHGEVSACLAYYLLPERWKLIGFMCVKRHHGDIDPGPDLFYCDVERIRKICEDMYQNIEELYQIYGSKISDFFNVIKDDKFFKEIRRSYRLSFNSFNIRDLILIEYIWSLLLTADKTQLIRGNAYKNKKCFLEESVSAYRNKIRNEAIAKDPDIRNTDLFIIKNQIYSEIQEEICRVDLQKDHVFSINVPTGTGKTLSVYGAAFKLCERIYYESGESVLPSVIYCLPFTSIIDQNYDVLEEIIKESGIKVDSELALKHHSMTPLKYSTVGENEESKEYRNYDARFCVENWQSTIITTTFVQLFDSIFKTGINSIGHRFHKLAGSVVILDEVQAIPPRYFKIIEEVFSVLCNEFNTYVITVTATKPLFLRGIELVKNKDKYFSMLNRITIENRSKETISLDDFCEVVLDDIKENPDKSFLIVLNTVKSSLIVRKALERSCRKVLYLSTEIYPARRLEIIKEIKENKDYKYVLVSTQLVEAGVDIDFDIVYRDFTVIDSMNQTAGRANRNGLKEKGIVKLYSIIDNENGGRRFSHYIYPTPLLTATEKILEGKLEISENQILQINEKYFEIVDKICSNDKYEDITKAIAELNFSKIRSDFELIKQDFFKEDIIINYNEETEKCLKIIQQEEAEYQDVINAWRTLSKYKVSINKKDLDYINCYCVKGANVLDKEFYNEDTGIIRQKTISI